MNKVFKVIWNEARNAYVVVSEIAKNRGSKSCSTKKLLAMLIATGVMTCASFDVLAAEPAAAETAKSQYVAFGDETAGFTNGQEKVIDGHKYIYDAANKYWVREGYTLMIEENGKLHTPLSANGKSADVAYTGGGDTGSILQSVASTVSANGTVTNMGESLNRITASAFAGVSHGGGTAVAGDWSYIIQDSSWKDKDSVASGNYKDGYADLIDKDNGMPKGFKTAEDPKTELNWDATKQTYTYKGKPVDYSNVYVIDGKIGVFTNKDGSEVYKGTVFGKNNEILMTVKDANNKFYSYWASEVTDPSATMQSYRMTEYKKDLSVLEENDNKLHRDDIREVTMTTDASKNSATIRLLRNGDKEAGAPVKGAITVTSGGGTDGKDTFVKISNGTANQTFATGSKVEVNGPTNAITGIKVNGVDYTIKQGSEVEVTQDTTKKTTTITVDGTVNTITDTDTTYTAGENVAIDENNKISVDLSQYAKTVDVAVVYNDKNSLHSTNSGKVGEKAIAFGQNAIADGKFSVAIGDSANVDANSVYTSSGAYSTAVGAASGAWGTQATAIGYNAQAKKQNAVALGFSASASATDSVAIGASSIANREAGSLGLYADGKTDSTWKATSGAVSIGSSNKTRQIINLAAGTNDTDAVNVAQLKKVKAEADKHTTLVAGANVTLNKEETENGLKYTISATGTNYTAGNGITISGENNAIAVNLKAGENNLEVTAAGLALKKDLNVDSVKAGEFYMSNAGIGYGDKAYITSSGLNANEQKITNVKAGEAETDAVNVGQLNKVSATAKTEVKAGTNITSVEKTTGANGQDIYTVNAKDTTYAAGNGITISGENNAIAVNLKAGENNLEVTAAGLALKKDLNVDSVKAGEFYMSNAGIGYGDKAYITSSGMNANNQTITNVKAGEAETDAVNVGQLNAVKETANKGWNLSTGKGEVVNVAPDATVDFSGDDNIKVSNTGKDVKVELNKALTGIESINGTGAGSISFADGVIKLNNKVNIDNTGKITGVAVGTIAAGSTDAVNGSQLYDVKVEAGKHSKVVSGNNINVEETDVDGQKFYKVNMNKDIILGDLTSKYVNISGTNGTIEATGYIATRDRVYADKGGKLADIDVTGNKISNGASSIVMDGSNVKVNDKVTIDQNGKISGVAAGVADTDAVNVGQLKEAVEAGNTDTHIKAGEYGVGEGNKVNMQLVDKNGNPAGTVTINDVAKASDVGNVNNIASDIKNQDGSKTTVVDAVNNLNNKLDNKVGDLNYVEGGKGNYVTNGENTTTSIGKLDKALKDVADTANQGWNLSTNGGEASKVAPGKTVDFSGDKNINISNDGTNVKVELNNNIKVDTVTTGQTVMNKDGLKVGDKVSVSATAVTAGKTSISDEGVKVDGKTYISADGLNANNNKITNVVDGKVEKDSKDAINGGQLHQAKADINNRIDGVENQVVSNTNRINKLGSRVNKVGAGAAALAALHPMDFDPDDKLTFSAGYGNYAGQNAAAIGAYYRPDEKVMFSVGGTVGNGENMVNAGISFALDRTNHVSNSRTAMAREILDLRAEVNELRAMVAKGNLGSIEEDKMKIFPDVAENHWAYEYIGKMAAAGMIEGYPDGSFGGDRMMTRYEFAAMLYRAMQKGAQLDSKIVNEFAPEMGRIRVDRISGEDGDRNKIERVRVNATKGERDHYGNKLK